MRAISSALVSSIVALNAAWVTVSAAAVPDPLVDRDGRRVNSRSEWTEKRRGEILDAFRENIYGRSPVERPPVLEFTPGAPETVFDGLGTRKPVTITYGSDARRGIFTLYLYIPEKPRGVFLLINNRAPEIAAKAHLHAPGSPGAEFFPVHDILSRGYVAASFSNREIAEDDKHKSFNGGVFKVFGPQGALDGATYPARPSNAWSTIAAWAWGASRAIDYFESDPALKDLPVAVLGHSRGGKTALWCGAQDTRVDLTISNSSGSTGAALARGKNGETIAMINKSFPYWFCDNYKRYNNREDSLPVDQHMLLALCAPRLVYVQSSSADAHADPAAEFRSCQLATPVYRLFGLKGIPSSAKPKNNIPLAEGHIGYHVRADGYEGDNDPGNGGWHSLKAYDWARYMDFADRHFARRNR